MTTPYHKFIIDGEDKIVVTCDEGDYETPSLDRTSSTCFSKLQSEMDQHWSECVGNLARIQLFKIQLLATVCVIHCGKCNVHLSTVSRVGLVESAFYDLRYHKC